MKKKRHVQSSEDIFGKSDGGDHRVIKRADLRMFEPWWEMVDEVSSKTSPGWSKTLTLYTKWKRKQADKEGKRG